MASGVEVIINGAAGGGALAAEAGRAAAEVFAACGVEARVSLARDGGELEEVARRALADGATGR